MNHLLSPKTLFSSPIVYTAIGYLAAAGSLLVQDAVIRGDTVSGSPISNFLAGTLVPLTLVSPIIGVVFGICHFRGGTRKTESMLGALGATPFFLLWLLALVRAIRYGMLAA